MDGISLETIITDQDAAISNAVAKVFQHVNHHYCMWHIEKKVPQYLNHIYHEHSEFKNQFYKCIHQSTTIEDFESDWETMIDEYELQDNQWLKKIYSIRAKWIPSYVRHNFCAGMSTTQRSESMNKFFKDFLNSSTPLSKFVKQYDKALEAVNSVCETVLWLSLFKYLKEVHGQKNIMILQFKLCERQSQNLIYWIVKNQPKEFVNSPFEDMPNASNNQVINLCDPPVVASKGRPRTLRMKGSLELLKKGSYNCGYCKGNGHIKLKCPSLKHGRCDIINGQLSNSKVKASDMVD